MYRFSPLAATCYFLFLCQQGAKKGKKAAATKKGAKAKGAWVGAVAKTVDGCKFYSKAKVRKRHRASL